MLIRPADQHDMQAIAGIIMPIIRAGETYTLPSAMSQDEAVTYWMGADRETFVAEMDGAVVGTYYLCANQGGGGSHVVNCGYMTSLSAAGRGVARAMCTHSLGVATHRGFRAMQFNFVVSTNERAINLWQKLGFDIVGRLPGAFLHPHLGYVDALVMYQALPPN